MIDLLGGDGSDSSGFFNDTVTSPTDVSLPLTNVWQQGGPGVPVNTDTSTGDTGVAADGFDMLGYNLPGNFALALKNDTGATVATPGGTSGFLDSIDKAFPDSFKQIFSGAVTAGTAAAKGAIGTAIGGSNPGPTNSNSNLANKSLLQRATALQQNLLGGILAKKDGGTNWLLIGGIVLLIFIIVAKLRG
jgi:hypothetical protein